MKNWTMNIYSGERWTGGQENLLKNAFSVFGFWKHGNVLCNQKFNINSEISFQLLPQSRPCLSSIKIPLSGPITPAI